MTTTEENANESLPDERNNDKNIEAKQPLTNGIHDQPQIKIKGGTDTTDDASYHPDDLEDPLNAMLAKRNKKRKYRTYDNGKKNRINLSPLKSNGIRIEKIIKQKTGLTRTGLVLAVLCIILAISLLVCLILWPKTSHSKEYPVCAKPSCLRSSAEILSKLNSNESICHNLQNYACGGWFASNPLPKDRSEWNLKELLQFQYRRKIHELIHTTPVATEPSSLLWKLKTAYDACMNVGDIRTDKALEAAIASELGGWEVMHGFSISAWDLRKTLTILYSKYSVSPFFIVDVVPDVTDSPKNIIRLRPPQLGLPNKSYYSLSDNDPVIVLYKHYIKDIVQLFGATVTDAVKFGESMFYFEKRVAEILENDDDVQTNYTRIAIGDLNGILVQIPLYEILLGKFAKVKNSDYVLVSSMPYFRNLAKLLSFTDLTSLNNYLIWRLISEYLPYFPQKYIETLNLYKKEFTGESEPMPRWEFCIATLQKFAGFGLLSLYENNLKDQEETNAVISNLFSELSTVIKKDILSNKKNELQNNLLDRLNKVGIQIGLPTFMLQQKYVNSYYASLNAMRYDFYQTIQYGVNFLKEDMEKRLFNPQEEYRWIDNMVLNPTSVTFNSDVDKVIVPSAVLQQPFFEKEYGLPSLYGGIGTEISKAIISSLLVDKTYYENGKKINPSFQEGNSEITGRTLLQYLSDCILRKNVANLNVTEKQSLISALIGIKYAYKGLTNELSNLNIHTHQPALETFENEELFFIISTQSSCSIKNSKKENHENTYQKTSSDKFLTKAISKYLNEFTEVFSCEEKSAYYESSLCRT
ncbi:endothelin-converting enzyme 1-like [Planococcus citri]|uniref:endothelin-converting enzyme 1-like n=1 Tax=Planococcus citri TaxID=170843 RepID=UPI0031F9F6CC